MGKPDLGIIEAGSTEPYGESVLYISFCCYSLNKAGGRGMDTQIAALIWACINTHTLFQYFLNPKKKYMDYLSTEKEIECI